MSIFSASGVRRPIALALCLALLASTNCATVRPHKVGGSFRSPQLAESGIRSVAVLPFENASGERGAGAVLTDEFTLQLGRLGRFDLVERGRIEELRQEQGLDTLERIDEATAADVGRMLGVDAVVLGTVTRFSPNPAVRFDTIREYEYHRSRHYPPIVVIGHGYHHSDCDVALAVLAVVSVVGIIYLLARPRPPAAKVGADVKLIEVESGRILWRAGDVLDAGRKSVQALAVDREERLRMAYDVDYLAMILCRELAATLAVQ